jgi:hypothetical protein
MGKIQSNTTYLLFLLHRFSQRHVSALPRGILRLIKVFFARQTIQLAVLCYCYWRCLFEGDATQNRGLREKWSKWNLTPRIISREEIRFSTTSNIPAFYGSQGLLPTFTRARPLYVPIVSLMNQVHSHPSYFNTHSDTSTHLCIGLQICLYTPGFYTKILQAFLFSPSMPHAPLVLSSLIQLFE